MAVRGYSNGEGAGRGLAVVVRQTSKVLLIRNTLSPSLQTGTSTQDNATESTSPVPHTVHSATLGYSWYQ